ncbi:OsmC family protein [bacterium]|nr:OsmC family protein [bacterium]
MPHKTVTVTTELSQTMKIDCHAGNHNFIIDQPTTTGGQDLGPTPLEYYLASLAGCISSIARIVAKQKNINLRGMKITTQGDINTDVLMGKNTSERAGFQKIALTVDVDADLSVEQKAEFLHEVEARCPVSENTINSTVVNLTIN